MKRTLMLFGVISLLAVRTYAGYDGWQNDFEQAKKVATEKKENILAVFAGSDWCSWCIKLDKEVWSKNEFQDFAKNKLVLFLADFPSSKKLPAATVRQNEALAEKYNVEGFPTVLILSGDGKVIARTGYRPGGVEKYLQYLKSLLKEG